MKGPAQVCALTLVVASLLLAGIAPVAGALDDAAVRSEAISSDATRRGMVGDARVGSPVDARAGSSDHARIGLPYAGTQDGFFNASDDVRVWTRAAFPLRVDTDDAETTLHVPDVFVDATAISAGEGSLNKRTIGVYEAGEPISLTFESRTGVADTTHFAGNEVELVVARATPETVDAGSTSVDRLLNLATNVSNESVDRNFTFTTLKEGNVSTDGSASFEVTPRRSGQYVFLLFDTEGPGDVSIADGNLSTSGQVSLVGVDSAPVQATDADVSVEGPDVEPGDDIQVEVESNLDGPTVDHVVLLVNESELADQSFTVVITDQIDGSEPAENVTIRHSIRAVRGVTSAEADATIFGHDFEDGETTGVLTIAGVIDALGDELPGTGPDADAAGETVVLNASVTAAEGPPATTLTVGTLENFSTGTYTLVYLAVNEDTGNFSSAEETVDIGVDEPDEDPPDGDGPPAPPGDMPPGPPGDLPPGPPGGGSGDGPPGPPDDVPPGPPRVVETPSGLTIVIGPTDEGADVTVEFNESTLGAALGEGHHLAGLTLVPAVDASGLNVSVTPGQPTPPADVPPLGGDQPGGRGLAYFTATATELSDAEIETVAFAFEVDESALPPGRDPGDVALFRYSEGSWTRLPTTYHASNDTYVATSPGFTAYAIGLVQEGPTFEVRDVTLGAGSIEAGAQTTVYATVENTGGTSGFYTANLTIEGTVVESRSVTLDPNESTRVTFAVSFDEPGTYDVGVSGVPAGAITVEARQTEPPTAARSPTGTGTGQPVVEPAALRTRVIAALLVLVGAVAMVGLSRYLRES